MHGNGIFPYSDGDKYASGDVYEGEYENGNMCGRGIYKFSDGTVYEGQWKDDKKHGEGVLKHSDGSVLFDGLWETGFKVTN